MLYALLIIALIFAAFILRAAHQTAVQSAYMDGISEGYKQAKETSRTS